MDSWELRQVNEQLTYRWGQEARRAEVGPGATPGAARPHRQAPQAAVHLSRVRKEEHARLRRADEPAAGNRREVPAGDELALPQRWS